MRIPSIVQAAWVANANQDGVGYLERPNDMLSPATTAPTTHANDHRPFVRSNATSDKSAAFRRCTRFRKVTPIPLRNSIGHSGARLRQAYGAAGPRPTNLSASQPATFHLSPLTFHLSPFTSHFSPLTSHPPLPPFDQKSRQLGFREKGCLQTLRGTKPKAVAESRPIDHASVGPIFF